MSNIDTIYAGFSTDEILLEWRTNPEWRLPVGSQRRSDRHGAAWDKLARCVRRERPVVRARERRAA